MPIRAADRCSRHQVTNLSSYARLIDFPYLPEIYSYYTCDKVNIDIHFLRFNPRICYKVISKYYGIIYCEYVPIRWPLGNGRVVTLTSYSDGRDHNTTELVVSYNTELYLGEVWTKLDKFMIGGIPATVKATPDVRALWVAHPRMLSIVIKGAKTASSYRGEYVITPVDKELDDDWPRVFECRDVKQFILDHYEGAENKIYRYTGKRGHKFFEIVYE